MRLSLQDVTDGILVTLVAGFGLVMLDFFFYWIWGESGTFIVTDLISRQ